MEGRTIALGLLSAVVISVFFLVITLPEGNLGFTRVFSGFMLFVCFVSFYVAAEKGGVTYRYASIVVFVYSVSILVVYSAESKIRGRVIIELLSNPIHLGEIRNDVFDPPDPHEYPCYIVVFPLQYESYGVFLRVEAKSVAVPREDGPVELKVNGEHSFWLNNLIEFSDQGDKDSSYGFRVGEYRLRQDYLKLGKNELSVCAFEGSDGFIDGVNIKSIQLVYQRGFSW